MSKIVLRTILGLSLGVAACSSGGDSTSPDGTFYDGWAADYAPSGDVLAYGVSESGLAITADSRAPLPGAAKFSGVGTATASTPAGGKVSVFPGADGLPRTMVADGTVLVFENWRNGKVDVGVVSPTGQVQTARDVSTGYTGSITGMLGDGTGGFFQLKVSARLLDLATCVVATGQSEGQPFRTKVPESAGAATSSSATCQSGRVGALAGVTAANQTKLANALTVSAASLGIPGCSSGTIAGCKTRVIENAATTLVAATTRYDQARDVIEVARGAAATGTGDIKVTLTWDNTADLDLWVTDPAGNRLYYANPSVPSGGELDVDDIDGFGPENAYWPAGTPQGGTFRVQVDHFPGPAPARWTVLVAQFGRVKTYTGTIAADQTLDIATFVAGGALPDVAASISLQALPRIPK
jgi:uncharacterized protein YfaP (DUF2135 family)